MSIQFEFKKYSFQEVASYFKEKKLKNLILFSQARSGSTFATENFSKFLNFKNEQIFNEANFLNKHFSYLKYFVKKHDNFFLNTNEFIYKRPELIKDDTLFVYLYRHHDDIKKSYEKAKKKDFYMGWEEFYSRYKVLFPNIDQNLHVALFNHYIWQKQISKFKHALTLDFNSFKNLDGFIDDRSNFVTLKQQKNSQVLNRAKKNPNINFNIFEKFYFFCIRRLESRKKNIINY